MAIRNAAANHTLMLAAVSLLVFAALLLATPAAHAQRAGEPFATVTTPANYLAETRGSSGETWGETYEYLEVYADGRLCGVLPLLNEDRSTLESDPVFELGLEGQAAVCSVSGARLSYIDSSGRILFQKDYLERGGEYSIESFGPEPPADPSPYPQVLIPARVLDTPGADAIDRLIVYGGEQRCGEISLTDPSVRNEDGDIVFHTHPYGGRICGDPREDELRFADPQGRLLQERFAFDFSRPMVLFDFALDNSGQTVPLPPSVGTGLASSANDESGTALTTLVVGFVAFAAMGWLVARQHRRAR